VVKQSFQTRRKTLRNALKSFNLPEDTAREPIFDKRAEQLSVEDFIYLTRKIQPVV
jgi:16S rRNA (adenine1518-N6/adenine1519-N6)-dimethyltransferase